MSASGSLATLGVAELLQVAALFRKMGSLCCTFGDNRIITVYFQDGHLSGLTDSGRVWQLGDLLESMGRLSERDKLRLLEECKLHGKRLGQLLLEEGFLSRREMETLLRRIIMQSLLFAVEHEDEGFFELELGAVSQTSVMFPITDFLIEITSAVDEYERLRKVLGPGGLRLNLDSTIDPSDTLHALPYRLVQVLAHVDGEKTPMDVAAASPFTPTETLSILCELAKRGYVVWATAGADPDVSVLYFPKGGARELSGDERPEQSSPSVRMGS
ncbi:MAG: hypothetical protein Kow00129_10810 [Thermoleophilia bacterium]